MKQLGWALSESRGGKREILLKVNTRKGEKGHGNIISYRIHKLNYCFRRKNNFIGREKCILENFHY